MLGSSKALSIRAKPTNKGTEAHSKGAEAHSKGTEAHPKHTDSAGKKHAELYPTPFNSA